MPTPINISASRGAAILGLSNWKTPVQVWLEIMEENQPGFCKKNNYELPEFEYNSAMKWGHVFESAIVDLAEKRKNDKIVDREKLYKLSDNLTYSTYFDFITCHIDGAYLKPEQKLVFPLHEGKTTSYFYFRDNFGEPGTDKVPIEYQIQCQHQMICTGAEKVIVSVLVFPRRVEEWEEMGWEVEKDTKHNFVLRNRKLNDIALTTDWASMLDQMGYFHQYEINAHPELQKTMIKYYNNFWVNNILRVKEPEPDSYEDIKCLVRSPIGTIVATEEIEAMIAERKNIKSEISDTGPLAKKAEQIKVRVLNYMKESEKIADDDSTDKWILLSRNSKKIASYGKDKNGNFRFR